MVMAVIYFMGAVGGAHLNPRSRSRLPSGATFHGTEFQIYRGAVRGGIAAACFLRVMFGNVGLLGATVPGPGISDLKTLILEVLLTAGLVNVILGTASGARTSAATERSRSAAILRSRPVGGADQRRLDESRSIVRARLAPRQSSHRLDLHRRPILGAMIAVGFEWILKGAPTEAGSLRRRATAGNRNPPESGVAICAQAAYFVISALLKWASIA